VSSNTVVVKYVKSCIGYSQRQKRTLHALGLKRLGDQVELPDNDAVQGMLDRISHLVQVTPDVSSGPDASSGSEPRSGPDSNRTEEE
jgi:large subunit ribosomal protein L30